MAAAISPQPDLEAALSRGQWFARLDPEIRRDLIENARTRIVRRNEQVLALGAPPAGLHALVSGQLRCQAESASGRMILMSVVHPGDWFGFLPCADGKPYAFDAAASVESEVLTVPMAVIRDIFHADPQLVLQLLEPQFILSRRIYDYLINSLRLPPLARLADRLLVLSRSPYYGDGDAKPIFGLSQELIATTIMCTRQTTNELLNELCSRGLIRSEYGRIEILDVDRLSKLASERK